MGVLFARVRYLNCIMKKVFISMYITLCSSVLRKGKLELLKKKLEELEFCIITVKIRRSSSWISWTFWQALPDDNGPITINCHEKVSKHIVPFFDINPLDFLFQLIQQNYYVETFDFFPNPYGDYFGFLDIVKFSQSFSERRSETDRWALSASAP